MTTTGHDVRPARTDDLTGGATRRARRSSVLRRILAVTDATAVTAALATSIFVLSTDHDGLTRFVWGLLVLPLWTLLFKIYGLYDRDGKRVSHSTVDDVPWLFHAVVIGTLGLWAMSRLPFPAGITSGQVPAFFVLAFVGIPVARAGARALASGVIPTERVLLVGGGPMARVLVEKIGLHPEYGLSVAGYVGDPSRELDDQAVPRHGSLADLEHVCRAEDIDRLVLVPIAVEDSEVADLVRVARGLDVAISILPHLVDVLGPAVEIDDVEGVTVLGMNPPSLTPSSRFLKRAMDVTIAFVCLVLLLPVFLVIALAVKLTSAGPVFYSQDRIGLGGRRFRMHKFRTMVRDADARVAELRAQSKHHAWLLLDRDPRITRVGRTLRAASLDELPQLWNVLKGDMSLVGPRPMPPDVDRHIYGWGRRRLDLTPGITGLWQVLGRTKIPFEEMVKLDYMYVTNWSLWQDLRLLVRTLPAVMRRRGAN